MTTALFLPWLPIVLSAGVGGRLMGRRRGLFFGACCALFWVGLVQAALGGGIWWDGWTTVALMAGAVSIAGMGHWAAEDAAPGGGGRSVPQPAAAAQRMEASEIARTVGTLPHAPAPPLGRAPPPRSTVRAFGAAGVGAVEAVAEGGAGIDEGAFSEALVAFDDWLERHRADADPWPLFDEFVRGVLHQLCRVTHVRVLWLGGLGSAGATSATPADVDDEATRALRKGIIGHVATTGRSYVAGDPTLGEKVHQLAAAADPPVEWCFAIRHGGGRCGVVAVGRLGPGPYGRYEHLLTTAGLVNLFTTTLGEACRSRAATRHDPTTGVLAREAFLAEAEAVVAEAYREGEPVAVAAITIEGLRRLDDAGGWEQTSRLVREAGQLIQHKVRSEDRFGRFDDARFVLLLRRVDSELAQLIVGQLLTRLETLCKNVLELPEGIAVRGGLAGSGTDTPSPAELIARALQNCHEARTRVVPIATDLSEPRRAMAGAV